MLKCVRAISLLALAFFIGEFQPCPVAKAQATSTPGSAQPASSSAQPGTSSANQRPGAGSTEPKPNSEETAPRSAPDEATDLYRGRPKPKPSILLSVLVSDSGDLSANLSVSAFGTMNTLVSSPDLKAALEAALSCRLQDASNGRASRNAHYSFYSGSCVSPLPQAGMIYRGALRTAPIIELARKAGVEEIQAHVFLPATGVAEIQTSPTTQPDSRSEFLGVSKRHGGATARYLWTVDQQNIPDEVTFQSGYTVPLPYPVLWLLATLLAPLAIIYVLGRKALSADAPDKAAVWFSFMRTLSLTLTFSQFIWWAAIEFFHLVPMLRVAFAGTAVAPFLQRWAATQWIGWIPPIAVCLLCYRISHPVQEKLRGLHWTKKELTLQSLYSACGNLIPIAVFMTGLSFLSTNSSAAATCFICAFVIRAYAVSALQKLTGMQPVAVTTGPLRDHAFDMARRAGVKLQQIYLIPSGKGQMANAFATRGNTVLFTDLLLERMSQPEIDYVMAHELTHLRLRHPQKLIYAYILGFFVGDGLLSTVAFVLPGPNFVLLQYLAMFGAITGMTYLFSRRFEYAADEGAVELTGNPRAAISAKFKLAQLNMLPTDWSRWSEKWLTHPSSLRRAEAIARKANIPLQEIPTIVREGASATPINAAHFVGTTSDKLFSSQYKRSVAQTAARILLAILCLFPCLVAVAALHLHGHTQLQEIVLALGVPATFAALLTFVNFAQRLQPADFERRLKQKLSRKGIEVDKFGGFYVGLAPAVAPRIYETTGVWDVGFIFFSSDRLFFCGEDAQFMLLRDQITDIQLGPSTPNYLASNRIYVAWRDDERGSCGVFNFGSRGGGSILGDQKRTIDLSARILAWRKSIGSSISILPTPLGTLTSPAIGAVTASVPQLKLRSRKVYNELVVTGLVAALGAMLLGLKFHLLAYFTQSAAMPEGFQSLHSPGMGWYVVAVAVLSRFLLMIPVLRYRDKPALVAQEPKNKGNVSTPGGAPAATTQGAQPAATPDPVATR
jgi:Zn-dependent protease with chaperone function